MDAPGWVIIIGAIFLGVTQVVAMVLQYLRDRDAAVKVKAVKETLEKTTAKQDAKLETIAETGEAVHTLVNSAMSQQLKIAAVALRRVADLTKHPDDIRAAEVAEGGHREHLAKQATVDSGGKTTLAAEVTP